MILARLCTMPGLPREADMPRGRTRGELVGELRALVSLQDDDRRQLAELQQHELQLVARIDRRCDRIDVVLDELIDWQAVHAMEAMG